MLYTYILTLYQKIFLDMIDKELISENIGKQNIGRAKFNDFITNMWYNEITLSEKGSIYYDYLKRVMELDKTFKEINTKYKLTFRYNMVERSNTIYKFFGLIGIISIGINIYNYFWK